MMRRYQSSMSRFNQPDPYDGSYNLADPQSFNRYAYTQNDPVNFVDPTGLNEEGPTGYVEILISFDPTSTAMYLRYLLFRPGGGDTGGPTGGETGEDPQNPTAQEPSCTFNINISGASGQELTDMQNEITRIFASGSLNVVFGQPQLANGGTMNLTVTTRYTGAAANVLTSQGVAANNPTVLGVTVPNSRDAYVNSHNIWVTDPSPYSSNTASLGTRFGRVGAHEAIQHGFLGTGPDGRVSDITRPTGAMALASPNTTRFNISAMTAAPLRGLCPP